MGSRSNRRSDRISISLPLHATGIDAENRPFIDTATTIVVNRHGALITLDRPLRIDQVLRVSRQLFDGSRREAEVRVVAHEKGSSGGIAYGIAFSDSKLDFWDIEFPPATEAVDAVVRLLVECSHCGGRELAYLNSRELKEFESNRLFARNCRTCESPTIWKQPLESLRHNATPDSHRGATGVDAASSPERETTRYDTRLMACVRERVGTEEMAVCENVSRQGVAFRSRRKYEEGAQIEVAVPYTQGTANVFIPAVVVHVRALPTAGLYRHGVKYLRKDDMEGHSGE
ncbi:MAG TPA: PilZ domain-containing protein [Candidatus Acidoferrales bacterium]|nr:PilZ domain-containing protein [Candidatus Acidoferrales bacterium]